MNILYCDCFSGISGDMFLSALSDAGMPLNYLDDNFRKLDLPEYHGVKVVKVIKCELAASQILLEINHPKNQGHESNGHHSPHRHLNDVMTIIQKGNYSKFVEETSCKIFQQLAEAESKVHGSSIEEVHFHEVGAVDSILDIVGVALGLEYFKIDRLYSSPLPLGNGSVETQHGLLPLPAPATLELLRAAHAPVMPYDTKFELVTPTGAAILAALADFSQPEMRINQIGIGAGQKELKWSNILRIIIGEGMGNKTDYLEIDTNIDDMNPQVFGSVMEKLFQAGALDVYFTPIYMKKNRPATKLSVITTRVLEEKIASIILRETCTLGVRVHKVWRIESDREIRLIETRYGKIPIKYKIIDGKIIQAAPEFDACLKAAEQFNVPVVEVLQEAVSTGRANIS